MNWVTDWLPFHALLQRGRQRSGGGTPSTRNRSLWMIWIPSHPKPQTSCTKKKRGPGSPSHIPQRMVQSWGHRSRGIPYSFTMELSLQISPTVSTVFCGTIVNYLHPGLQKWRTSHHLPQQVVWKGCRPRHQGLHSLACERWPPHQHRSYNEGREYHTVQVQCTQKYTTRTGGIGTEGRPSHPRPLSEGNCQCPRHYWKATITSVILPLFISWKVLVMSFNFFLFPDHN